MPSADVLRLDLILLKTLFLSDVELVGCYISSMITDCSFYLLNEISYRNYLVIGITIVINGWHDCHVGFF